MLQRKAIMKQVVLILPKKKKPTKKMQFKVKVRKKVLALQYADQTTNNTRLLVQIQGEKVEGGASSQPVYLIKVKVMDLNFLVSQGNHLSCILVLYFTHTTRVEYCTILSNSIKLQSLVPLEFISAFFEPIAQLLQPVVTINLSHFEYVYSPIVKMKVHMFRLTIKVDCTL